MKTEVIIREAIVGKHVEFNSRELEQMAEMCDKIATVLDNHEKKDEKKIYLKTNSGSVPFCYAEDFPKIKEKAKLLGVNIDNLNFIEV